MGDTATTQTATQTDGDPSRAARSIPRAALLPATHPTDTSVILSLSEVHSGPEADLSGWGGNTGVPPNWWGYRGDFFKVLNSDSDLHGRI